MLEDLWPYPRETRVSMQQTRGQVEQAQVAREPEDATTVRECPHVRDRVAGLTELDQLGDKEDEKSERARERAGAYCARSRGRLCQAPAFYWHCHSEAPELASALQCVCSGFRKVGGQANDGCFGDA